ncbi:MAG: hypothetical protein KAT28_01150 [Candidatus Aenigmarchaeota archaeon]|nr:hypothetical protein [Candidatus Aenigmarchaeota archaeon]
MGVVRVDDKLQKDIQKWIKKNGNKYQYPSITAFINNAIYEKLKKDGENGSK